MFYSHSTSLIDNQSAIEQHWQSCTKGNITTPFGEIFYLRQIPKHAKYTLLLVNGRIESAYKYKELLWELGNNNIGVVTFDHPGQGFSSRLLANRQIGHIDHFKQYREVLEQIISKQVLPYTNNWLFLAHSMGGAIVRNYLAHTPNTTAKGAFLSAPMFAINTAPYPVWFAKWVANAACKLGQSQQFAIGQQPYQSKPFSDNELTGCSVRYQQFRSLYDTCNVLQLGGVSFGWLYAALAETANTNKQQISIPISIASAEHDSIVNSDAHSRFAARQEQCFVKTYPGKHELLCEIDAIRQAVLTQCYEFAESVTLKETGS
ncbi:alpha/beta fold hydrolase [Pseudoalteromonas luteoviolacea]|uniref:alpha/beta fold hydrolase n=1 Tax=Pseudoalteromonas luteoviolacea TaxID=43657 RepID=UPI001B3731C1|nr:alpha/beta fold hydrolase [Pseudoalteromonas luteoviolacea]MBQ4838410.1 alpha/beta fold hydrolase [Pseudoalteromonas luteoviolacea]